MPAARQRSARTWAARHKLPEQSDLAERLTQRTHKIDGHMRQGVKAKAIGLERLNPMQGSTDQAVCYSRVLPRGREPMDPACSRSVASSGLLIDWLGWNQLPVLHARASPAT